MSSTNGIGVFFSSSPEGGGSSGRTAGGGQAPVEQQRTEATRRRPMVSVSLCISAALILVPARASAQTPAPAAAPAAPPPSAPPAAPAPAVAPPPAAPPPGGGLAAQNATPPLATESMPATREEKLPPISVGAWLRIGGRIQGTNPKNLDGEQMDTLYAELHAGGKIHKNVSLTLNLNASGLAGTAGIEDAILGFDFADPIHLWIGQLLVPVDRANYGGPFFMIPWNYPGFLTVGAKTVVTAPKEGPSGRNGGAVLWGDVEGGKFNYKLGVFQAGNLGQSPLFSGRLSLALLGNETGYFGNETYFGDKDIVSVAVGGQAQKNGGTAGGGPADYFEFNSDVLAELKYGGGGWVTGDISYYHFEHSPIKDAFYLLGAIATPKIGIGNIQPMVRYQFGAPDGPPKAWAIDVFVSYLIMGPALRLMAGVQHTELGNDAVGNAIQLAAQGIFF
jgi:hypothetical protein